MLKYCKIKYLSLSILCLFSVANARQELVPGSRYTSGRGAAMGDAALPLADDGASGLFYNPAGIAKAKDLNLEPLNIGLYGNSGFTQMLNLNFYKVFSLSDYVSTLQNHPGQFAGVGFSVLPSYYGRGFAIGMLLQSQIGAVANADGTIRYRSLYQFVPAVGTGIRLASGIVRFGYSLQWVNQATGDMTVPASTDPMGYNQGLAQGSAFSHNFGFALTLPIAYLPAVNLVARNVLTTKFSDFSLLPLARNSSGAPSNEPVSYDGSFSLTPKLGGGSYVNLVVQYRDMTNTSGVAFIGRMAGGMEISVKDQVFLRGGWSSGYPSAGIGFKKKGGEFSLSWYSEELGTSYLSLRDTRYFLHYQIRAF